MIQAVPNLLLAGVLLALLEVVWVLVRARGLFLSLGERVLYASASITGITTCVLLLGCALFGCVTPSRFRTGMRVVWSLAWLGLAAGMAWSLSDGRRVRDLTARPYAVAAIALVVAVAAWLLPPLLERQRARAASRSRVVVAALCLLVALAALCADALILPRGYPAFHLALAVLAGLLASVGALSAPALPLRWPTFRLALLAALVALAAPFLLHRLATHPTAGFAVRETAPWSARLTSLLTPTRERATSLGVTHDNEPDVATVRGRPGVDLRDRDILLITVDALRADMLTAYGGSGRTPQLDKLAAESAVFMRAYTPAPHTSYALASLLTGKFVKPLVELGEKLGDPPTLPDRLRRYGYRTAAFYPPAIFFVDGKSFEPLQKRGFGFEYRKEMFASAPDRVAQLSAYLEGADAKRPLFAWVHLFEPHEPYAPPPDSKHDGSERGRYEAEVAVCDRAIAELITRFRAARPRATVIVTADHGEEFGDHGGSFHGTSLYDEQVRIPLLWSSPGVVAPRHIHTPVELTDVGTTILSTAAIPRDAHMRGDELGAVLAGDDDAGPRHAFASIDARHMITDGTRKLICSANEATCALFDLERDRLELHNLAGAEPRTASRMREVLDAFLSSIARAEAVTVSEGVRLPEALARAKLFGTTSVEELLPLLKDARAAVRLEAARALAELGDESARAPLALARQHDVDTQVRAEAAIAALTLGEEAALAQVLPLLHARAEQPDELARARRAALALARFDKVETVPVLEALVRDESATESERLRAVRALGSLHDQRAVAPLTAALSFVRLREAAAAALGQVGGSEAIEALRRQLREERYPPARAAEARALQQLHDARAPALVRHFLGMESSLPAGVRLLVESGELTPSSRAGALLADARVRSGDWSCVEHGCMPEHDARVVLPARGESVRGPVRVTLWYRDADPGSTLRIDGVPFVLQTPDDQLSFVRARVPSSLSFERAGSLLVSALVVAPAVAEIPPPPPEPWAADDAGVAVEPSASDAGRSSVSAPVR